MSVSRVITTNLWVKKNNNDTLIDRKILDEEQEYNNLITDALKEIREDETTRTQCLEQLRNWIAQNPDIENCPTDDRFLLSFLRMKKFSLLMAQQTLLKYLNFRKRFQHFMYNLDYLDRNVYEIINNGYMFVSPYRDNDGRRIILYNLKKFDPHQYNSTDMARVHAIIYETLLADEDNQILGLNHVADIAGISAAVVTIWSVKEFATIIRWGEQSFPMRHKEINIVNLPSSLKYIYDFAQTNIKSEKLRKRFIVHNSLQDLHKRLNKDCLPLEFGGVMPMKTMIELWKKELQMKRELLLTYDRMNLLSDQGIIRSKSTSLNQDNQESLPGSFRKLEVD